MPRESNAGIIRSGKLYRYRDSANYGSTCVISCRETFPRSPYVIRGSRSPPDSPREILTKLEKLSMNPPSLGMLSKYYYKKIIFIKWIIKLNLNMENGAPVIITDDWHSSTWFFFKYFPYSLLVGQFIKSSERKRGFDNKKRFSV